MNQLTKTARVAAFATLMTTVATAGVAQTDRATQKLAVAHEVYQEFVRLPEKQVPRRLLEEAQCIAIIPNVIKGAFVWGGRRGRGVMTCRQAGGWSPVTFLRLTGGSFGLQIGGESADLLLFFLTERGARSLIDSKFILGGDAGVAAGPLGRSAEMSTDLKLKAEIFSYAKTRGAFAGLSVEGARLAPDHKWNGRYYGAGQQPEDLLFGDAQVELPASARRLLSALP